MTARTIRHAITATATARSSPTVFTRGRRRARTSDLMIRSPLLRWDTVFDRASDPHQPGSNTRISNRRGSVSRYAKIGPRPRRSRVDFAERHLWNVRPRASVASLRFDVGCADHFAPFLRFVGDELAEIKRRACNRDATEPYETGLHRSISKAGIDFLVQLFDDFGGRVLGC